MKSFYSIISISPNSNAHERLSLGIIASNGKRLFFKSSKRKKNLINSLLGDSSKIIDFVIKELTDKIEETNKLNQERAKGLFELNELLDGEYFNYLKNYSNGLLLFSDANYIATELNTSLINQLFKLYVDSASLQDRESKKSDRNFKTKIESNLLSKVSTQVHTNLKVEPKIVPSISSSFDLDCIGKNGSIISAKSLLFSSSMPTITKEIGNYFNVMYHFSNRYSKGQDNQMFLIADEPTKENKDQKKYFNNLRKDSLVKLISSDEAEKVAYEIEKSGAQTFLNS